MRGTICNLTISNSNFQRFGEVRRTTPMTREKRVVETPSFAKNARRVNLLLRRRQARKIAGARSRQDSCHDRAVAPGNGRSRRQEPRRAWPMAGAGPQEVESRMAQEPTSQPAAKEETGLRGRAFSTAGAFLAAVDERLSRFGRAAAKTMPLGFLSIALIVIGSLLIWLGPKPATMVTLLFNGLDCLSPAVGRWLGLSCAQAPPWYGVLSLRTYAGVAIWFGLLLLITAAIWVLGRMFVSISSRIVHSDLVRIRTGIARKVLIMGLSPADPARAIKEAQDWAAQPGLYAGPAPAWKVARAQRGIDVATPAAAGGWQQAARMMQAHLAEGRLLRTYVLPSHETKDLLGPFKAYLETVFGRTLDIRPVVGEDGGLHADSAAPVEREQRSYDFLRDGLGRAVDLAKQDAAREGIGRLADSDICIDATAGFKLFSIAAAVVTFDRNIVLGYVVTGGGGMINPDEGVVKLYDPRIEFLSAVRNKVVQSSLPGP
jgi:hypothetical protein